MADEFDYVVVGGGSAGAVVAARLAEDGSASVCLLEAGPSDEGMAEILELPRWPSSSRRATTTTTRRSSRRPARLGDSPEPRARPRRVRLAQRLPGVARARVRPACVGGTRGRRLGAGERGRTSTRSSSEPGSSTTRRPATLPAPSSRPASRPATHNTSGTPTAGARGTGWVQVNARGRLRRSASVSYLHPLSGAPGQPERRDGHAGAQAHARRP